MRIGSRLTTAEFALLSRCGTASRTTDGKGFLGAFLPGGSGLQYCSLGAGDCGGFVDLPLRHVGQFANLPINRAIRKML
jgi:hypothetical protein